MTTENPESQEPRATIRQLEEEMAVLRHRLQEAPRRIRLLEEQLIETKGKLVQASQQNEKLAAVLTEAREQLAVLRQEVEKLSAPPNAFATVLQVNDDGTVDISAAGRKLRVLAQPTIEVKQLQVGQEVLLNDASNIVDVRTIENDR